MSPVGVGWALSTVLRHWAPHDPEPPAYWRLPELRLKAFSTFRLTALKYNRKEGLKSHIRSYDPLRRTLTRKPDETQAAPLN